MVNGSSKFKAISALRGRASRLGRLGLFVSDQRGVAAIEFALVVPLMLAMCLVTWELALAIETSRKVGRAGSMVGDLVAQSSSMSPQELQAIMQLGSSTIQPYNRSKPTITVTAIEITEENGETKSKVAWSYQYGPTKLAEDPTIVPAKIKTPGSFLIRVDSALDYVPVITWEGDNKAAIGLGASRAVYPLRETYYLRPRVSQTISCTACS